MKLNEKIARLVRRILKEDFGINTDVIRATRDIMEMINTMDDNEFRKISISKNRHYPCKAANIDYDFVNKNIIRVNVCVYEFKNDTEFRDFCSRYPEEMRKMTNAKTRQTYESSKITIALSVITIDGQVMPSCYNALQHELEHAFQRIMSRKSNIVKNQDKYSRNIRLMGKQDGIYVKNAARINYYSYPHEQSAFMNGLYGELKYRIGNGEDFESALGKTKYVSVLNQLKKIVNDFSRLKGDDKTDAEAILMDKFNYGVDAVIKKGLRTINDFTRNLWRVKTKIMNETNDK